MKKNEKILIGVLLIILIIAIILFLNRGNKSKVAEPSKSKEYVQVLGDGTQLNVSEELNREKNVDGFKFKNIQLTNKDGQTVILADVTNETKKATKVTLVDVILLDKEGKELTTIGGIIAPLEAGQTTQFNASMQLDFSNAYDFQIIIK